MIDGNLYDAYQVSKICNKVQHLNQVSPCTLDVPESMIENIKLIEENVRASNLELSKFITAYNNEELTIYLVRQADVKDSIIMYGVIVYFPNIDGVKLVVSMPTEAGYTLVTESSVLSDGILAGVSSEAIQSEKIFMDIASKVTRYKAVPIGKYKGVSESLLGLNMVSEDMDFVFNADNEGNTLVYDEVEAIAKIKNFEDLAEDDVLLVYFNKRSYHSTELSEGFDPSSYSAYMESIASDQFVFTNAMRSLDIPVSNSFVHSLMGEAAVSEVAAAGSRKAKRLPKTLIKKFKGFEGKLRRAYANYKNAKEDETRERVINDEIIPISDTIIGVCVSAVVAYGAVAMGLVNPIIGLLIFGGTKTFMKSKSEKKREHAIYFLKKELEIIDEKIADAKLENDRQAKYRLMRMKTKIERKIERIRTEDDVV